MTVITIEGSVFDSEIVNGVILTPMTEAERAHYLEHGCDPACHACFALIPVGEEYGYVEVLSADEAVSHGLSRNGVQGMFCGNCVREGRRLSEEEFAHMLARTRAGEPVDPPDPRREQNASRKKAVMKRLDRTERAMPEGRGCFLVGGKIVT